MALERLYKTTGLREAQAGKRDRAPELMRGSRVALERLYKITGLRGSRRPASATARPSLCEASLRGA